MNHARRGRITSSMEIYRGIVAIFFFAIICSCSTVIQAPTPAERAKEFLSNLYTGKQMREEEWLSREAAAASLFKGFGGLERMVQQSTARAERYGGLRSVEVREAKSGDKNTTVTAEIKFVRNHKSEDEKPVPLNEDITWELRFVREDGVWKIAP
jgi:hypothetical protein